MKKQKKRFKKTNTETRILIVDDHQVVREGLKNIINWNQDLRVCAEAANLDEAVNAVKKEHIDLVLVDMLLDDLTGTQVIQKINELYPEIIHVVFSMSDNLKYVKEAVKAGARGYIMKEEIADNIVDAIHKIIDGNIYISNKLLQNMSKEERNCLIKLQD